MGMQVLSRQRDWKARQDQGSRSALQDIGPVEPHFMEEALCFWD